MGGERAGAGRGGTGPGCGCCDPSSPAFHLQPPGRAPLLALWSPRRPSGGGEAAQRRRSGRRGDRAEASEPGPAGRPPP